ncbi:hypothetical protein Tco_0558708 [Tanacetum coccineum]
MEKRGQANVNQVKVKVNPDKVKAKTEEMLNRPTQEKSPPYSSHRGFKASKLSYPKSPMLIHGDNSPNLGVRHPHFYPLDKLNVENLVQIPSESKDISDDDCDVPLCNNPTPLEAFKEHSEIVVDFNDDSTSSDDDSPYGEDIDYVDASPPDAEFVSLEVVEIVIPEVGGITTYIPLTIKDDILREKLLNVNLLIAKIEALKDNPTPSSDVMTKSSSTSPNFFLEETNTVDISLPKTKTFCFNLEEISSGSPTSYSDLSLSDYEAFYLDDGHVEEKSSGSTTTHTDFSQYNSFVFDLSINPCPPVDRSDRYHEEFAYNTSCFRVIDVVNKSTMYLLYCKHLL